MFGLDTTMTVLLIACIVLALFFEFINGFHDTANAVATVIYTKSMKPVTAVIWSGIWNAAGVMSVLAILGLVSEKLGVANNIIGLLPSKLLYGSGIEQTVPIILSILVTAIVWNLGTWYFGIPCSSSHTLIGSIIGAAIGFSLANDISLADGVKWDKARDIGLSLLFSPLIGFSITILVMFLFKALIKNKKFFKEVDKNGKPDFATRLTLIGTCTAVSYAHGSNDGQKGMGLMMLILIAFAPAHFALSSFEKTPLEASIAEYRTVKTEYMLTHQNEIFKSADKHVDKLDTILHKDSLSTNIPIDARLNARKEISKITKEIEKIYKDEKAELTSAQIKILKSVNQTFDNYTGQVPWWIKVLIALALGIGTMIGWKRIVVTIGEKIGKQHLTYAQGASAELVAASTIGLASGLGLPVSTTQVLSSGIAGSMVASKGIKNLQKKTIKTIALAWLLTLPVTVVGSVLFYMIFKMFF